MTIAVAPAACALRYLSMKPQTPRTMNAILPLTAAAFVSGAQPFAGAAVTSESVIGPVCASVTGPAPSSEGYVPTTAAGALTRKREYRRPPGVFAALAIAELATPGAPVMYGKSPSLPA